jgi:Fe(3+) dicitrate transport protein
MKLLSSIIYLALISTSTIAQTDTIKSINLKEIEVSDQLQKDVERLPDVQDAVIYAGKKNEVLKVSLMNADLSVNNSRQVFGKVPGVTVWENDGSGIQVGVATRGLSPNRSWEFNVRQNGYDICSEVFGYPEAYYNPPMEALEKIEIVRGAASLSFGPQFGGLLNYVIKKGDAVKPVTFEIQQTLGSYGLFNSYNAIGGTYKKLNYYAYFHHRNADGWRENSQYDINTGYISLDYSLTSKLSVGLQYTNMSFESQQPGGLTDSLFAIDPKKSFRERNWFSAPWNVSSLNLNYEFNSNTRLNLKVFNTNSGRNSIGFTNAITVSDTINSSLNNFNNRQVDRDKYKNTGAELRFLTNYTLLKKKHTLSAGVRAYKGNTHRRQLGVGTAGNDYDMTISNYTNGKEFGRDLKFTTENASLFAENIFNITSKLSLTPGIRFESIKSTREGYINTSSSGTISPQESKRNVILYGIGAQYHVTSSSNIYANYSTAYRPVTFSELTPSSTTEIIDQELKDANGYNMDLGYRGRIGKILNFDVGIFYLYYNDRIGTITQNNLPYRTNIGTSVSKGIESLIEVNVFSLLSANPSLGDLTIYSSLAFIDAKYTRWNNQAIANDPAKSIDGKRVENSPEVIARYGINYSKKGFSVSFQLNSIGDVFTDAPNTEIPNAGATIGKLPSYQVMDASLTYRFGGLYNIKAGINNISDEMYATRRSGGYPGPGIMPANGRTLFLGIGVKL